MCLSAVFRSSAPRAHSETINGLYSVSLYGKRDREKRQAALFALPSFSSNWVAMETAPSKVVWPFYFGSRHQCCLRHNKIITCHRGSIIPRISFGLLCSGTEPLVPARSEENEDYPYFATNGLITNNPRVNLRLDSKCIKTLSPA